MKTARLLNADTVHAVNPMHEVVTSYCGYPLATEVREDIEPTCRWCRDRLNLKPQDSSKGATP